MASYIKAGDEAEFMFICSYFFQLQHSGNSFGIRTFLILYKIRSYAMCLVLFLLYIHLGSHSFYLLFMFLLLHILFWCRASAYWDAVCSYSSHFFLLMFFLPWGHFLKSSIYRLSPNHLTCLPHLLKHCCYYPSALCFASTFK